MTGEAVERLFCVGSRRAGTMIWRDLLLTGDAVSSTTGEAAAAGAVAESDASEKGRTRFTPRVTTVGPAAAAAAVAARGCITVYGATPPAAAARSCFAGAVAAAAVVVAAATAGTTRVGVVDTETDATCTERKVGVVEGRYVSCWGGGCAISGDATNSKGETPDTAAP